MKKIPNYDLFKEDCRKLYPSIFDTYGTMIPGAAEISKAVNQAVPAYHLTYHQLKESLQCSLYIIERLMPYADESES